MKLVGLFSLVSVTVALRGAADDASCSGATNESACFASSDQQGNLCVWCECQAIPSECLTLEQSKLVPPGVFDCKSPSSMLSKLVLTETTVADDFCDAGSKSGYVSLDESEYDKDGEDKHLFYWMFDKRNSDVSDNTIPLIVWLTGGPGCSSSL
jgi:hypothetical protein